MKTFATKEKRPAPAARKARPYVHHPMGPVQRAQQAAMREILRPDEVQAKPDIGENDGKFEQEIDHAAANLPVSAISGMPPGGPGCAPALQRSETEEPEEELQRQPEEEEEEPVQAKLMQRQPDNEEKEEPVQAMLIQRQIADRRGVRPSRFGYAGSEAKAQQRETRRILRSTGAQARLTVGQPNDKYEQEADRVADQVMAMPDPKLQRLPENDEEEEPLQAKFKVGEMLQRMCSGCEEETARRQPEEDEDEGLQAKANRGETPTVTSGLESRINGIKGGGQPLNAEARSFFEPRFGSDFSDVRLHTDSQAAESARTINARAFTLGRNIVFGAGEYSSDTPSVNKLLAHELVHTLQQGGEYGYRLSRVPTEGGVQDGRYTFTRNCGWIDWSHAGPGIGSDLIARVRAASDAIRSAGTSATPQTGQFTSTAMSSRVPHVGTVLSSAAIDVRLLRALSSDEVLAAALSIFKKLSIVFETQQQWTQLIGRSSFSQEDLPSNLVGFYRGARGFSQADINGFCGSFDVAGSLAEYERDHDFEANRTFSPIGATGPWPAELSTINESGATALYEIRTISARQGTDAYRFCPMYRVEGLIGETDLFILSVGGTRFTTADNLRVAPTYRARPGTSGRYGHVNFIEVEPYSQPDIFTFNQHGISWPIYLPEPVLICLDSSGNPV